MPGFWQLYSFWGLERPWPEGVHILLSGPREGPPFCGWLKYVLLVPRSEFHLSALLSEARRATPGFWQLYSFWGLERPWPGGVHILLSGPREGPPFCGWLKYVLLVPRSEFHLSAVRYLARLGEAP